MGTILRESGVITSPLVLTMSVMRFLLRTSLASLLLCYGLDWFYFTQNNDSQTTVDCAQYKAGQGLDKNGQPFQDLESFYPYYLCEHTLPTTKLFHFIATFNALSLLGKSIVGPWQWSNIALGLFQGYGLAWYSHFNIEQNKPATWMYPGLSFVSDQKLFVESLLGKHKLWQK